MPRLDVAVLLHQRCRRHRARLRDHRCTTVTNPECPCALSVCCAFTASARVL
jgi:hypothetical protein